MNAKNSKYVIFGTGAIGIQLAKILSSAGKEVVAVNRSGNCAALQDTHVKIVQCDATKLEEVAVVLEGCQTAVNCVGLPYAEWEQLIPIMKNIITVCQENNIVLGYVDNLYLYGDIGGQIFETTVPKPHGRKGKIRLELSRLVCDAAKNKKLEMVIGRSSDFYGPYVDKSSVSGPQVIDNVIKGKSAMYIGKTDVKHSMCYIEDVAKAMILLLEDKTSYGEVWHLPVNPPIKLDDTVHIISKILNKEVKTSKLPWVLLNFLALFNRDMREFKEMYYMYSKPFVVNDDKFRNKYQKFETTSYQKGFENTIYWYQNKSNQ